MVQVSNSPREATLIRAEARKSLAFGLWLKDGSGAAVDLSASEFTLVVAKVNIYDQVTVVIHKTAFLVAAEQGFLRFLLQASDLDLAKGTYQFTTTMTTNGYSSVLLKGDFEVLPNTDVSSVLEEYTLASPAQTLEVQLQATADVHVELNYDLPPDVVRVPFGGNTGQALVKASNDSWDLVWSSLEGGLAAEGVAADKAPVALGNGTWQWLTITLPSDLTAAIDAAALTATAYTDESLAAAKVFATSAAETAANHLIPSVTAAIGPLNYPAGITYFPINGEAGWPTSTGTVETVRVGDNRTHQVIVNKVDGRIWTRAVFDVTTWGAFREASGPGHVHTAAEITSGTLADARLPARWGVLSDGGFADFNLMTATGFYRAANAANNPGGTGWWYILVEAHQHDAWISQRAIAYTGTPFVEYRRQMANGVWSNWYRVYGQASEIISALTTAAGFTLGTNAGTIAIPGRVNSAHTAFAQAAGTGNLNILGIGGAQTLAVTFPAGRFTNTPNVVLQSYTTRYTLQVSAGTVTTSGFTLIASNFSGAGASGASNFNWQAMQMSAGAGNG